MMTAKFEPKRVLTVGLMATLGYLAAVSSLATDMYLSSVPEISQHLNASASSVQLTFTMFFLGVAIGQLLLGPLSDALGRRPVLLGALIIFTASGIAMVFSPNIETLIGLRLLQGLSGAAGMVLARAIAADLSTGETAVKALSLIAMFVGLGPLLAPPIGGAVHSLFGWRGVLAALAIFSALMLALAWARVPESLETKNPNIKRTYVNLGTILKMPLVVVLGASYALAFATMLAYIAASPFVGQNILNLTPFQFSLVFAVGGSAIIIANLVNSRLAARVGARRMFPVGLSIMFAGSGGMLLFVVSGSLTLPTFILSAFFITAGTALTMSNSSALILAATSSMRGAASALIGASQFILAGIVAPIVGSQGPETALPMGLTVTICSALALGFGLGGISLIKKRG